MNTRSFPSFETGLLPSIVPSLSATPASKKRGAEDSASSSASSNESHTDISKNLVPWVPNKCRAVAGPQQKEIDRERSTRRRLEERLTLLERQRNSMSIENGRLRALDVARRRDLGELSRLLDYQNNVNSKETERQELLIALRKAQQKISSMEESLEQWKGLVEVCNSTIAELIQLWEKLAMQVLNNSSKRKPTTLEEARWWIGLVLSVLFVLENVLEIPVLSWFRHWTGRMVDQMSMDVADVNLQ
ncbi:hypothetical protein K435DRAFT_873311 [Dendrothele bispora CBS 962.96]|uniref:Uncharacterized protein n=1 Tax=Dendrothele bispora (strain CBS 962.96) TaxID=1314807 RepID=A0A4S8KZH3_DENBC|nr:hypothetical protein K435DRAFT_873311 [Dendrothele bispora CBS 962.96]